MVRLDVVATCSPGNICLTVSTRVPLSLVSPVVCGVFVTACVPLLAFGVTFVYVVGLDRRLLISVAPFL